MSPPTATPVSAVVVSWNVLPLLRRCLESLLAQGGDLEVIVVDNASGDGTEAAVRAEYPQVRLVQTGANLGYPAGINAGLRLCRHPLVLLLNPDAIVAPRALAALVRLMERDAGLALVAPRLLFPDGSPQPSRRRFPTRRDLLIESTPLQRLPGGERLLRRFYRQDSSDAHVQEVDWVYGACLLLRARALHEVGGMDAGYFMYSEEVDLCRRLKAGGWSVAFEPAAAVVHHEGQSSDQVPTARLVRFNRAKVLYALKHFGPATAELLRLHLLALMAGQAAIEAAKLLLGHKRELRRQRIAAYLTVLRDGLRRPA